MKKIVGFTVKQKVDGFIEGYEARVVDTRPNRMNYEELFELVVEINTVQFILSLTAK